MAQFMTQNFTQLIFQLIADCVATALSFNLAYGSANWLNHGSECRGSVSLFCSEIKCTSEQGLGSSTAAAAALENL